MQSFGYVRPQSVAEALALLAEPGVTSRVLAGGTDLMVLARAAPVDYDRLVDVSRIPDLHGIASDGERLRVGAAVTYSQASRSPLVREYAPFLAEACRSIGTEQIANMATLGGNAANAAAAADSVTVLVALNAEALIATPAGAQRMLVADLILGHNRTDLPRDGLITAFEFAPLPARSRSVFLKIGRRNALSIARMNLAAVGRLATDGTIAEARLAAGACFRRPRRVRPVEEMLLGRAPTADLFAAAGQEMARLMLAETGQRWSTEYKVIALAALVEEALERVTALPERED